MIPRELAGRLTLTVPEAGRMLGLGRGSAYAAARRGDIPTLPFNGRLVVPVPKLLIMLGVSAAEVEAEHADATQDESP
jgi:hypothetical protein